MNRTLAPIAALLLSVAILLTGQGLQFALLPVRAALENFQTLAIGVMGAAYFLGFTLGCLRGGELVRRVGHVRVFLAMTAIASAGPLIHVLAINAAVWVLLRMLSGFCFATLYVVIESWLNGQASNDNRGLIFSTYTVITLSVMAVGQMSLLLYSPSGPELFILASVIVSIGAVPVALSTSPSPEAPRTATVDLARLYQLSPSGTIGCLAAGFINGSFWAVSPVFGTRIGGVSFVAFFMTAVVVGGAIGQWPLGILSDRIGRRKILLAALLGACAVGIALAWFASGKNTLLINLLGALWGAMAFPLYAIAVAYANDYAGPAEHVMVSSGLLLAYGIGAMLGPFVASALMGNEGTGILFAFCAAGHFMTALFVFARKFRRARIVEHPVAFADALAVAQTASQVYDEVLEQAELEAKGQPPRPSGGGN